MRPEESWAGASWAGKRSSKALGQQLTWHMVGAERMEGGEMRSAGSQGQAGWAGSVALTLSDTGA